MVEFALVPTTDKAAISAGEAEKGQELYAIAVRHALSFFERKISP